MHVHPQRRAAGLDQGKKRLVMGGMVELVVAGDQHHRHREPRRDGRGVIDGVGPEVDITGEQ